MTAATTTLSSVATPPPKGLYLAAHYPTRTEWLPVGYLTRADRLPQDRRRQNAVPDGNPYLFSFLQSAREAKFPFFLNQEDLQWEVTYVADHLPPPFSARVRSPLRPDYQSYIASLGLDEKAAQDPFTLLARSGGRKHTDWYETFAAPEPDADGQYRVLFFLRGLRHLDRSAKPGESSPLDAAVAAVRDLQPGERLYPMSDLQNAVHKEAIALRTEGKVMIGYMPRHLANDFRQFLNGGGNLQVRVECVNPEGTLALMLLCQMTCAPPANFRPCSDPNFKILSPNLRDMLVTD